MILYNFKARLGKGFIEKMNIQTSLTHILHVRYINYKIIFFYDLFQTRFLEWEFFVKRSIYVDYEQEKYMSNPTKYMWVAQISQMS